MNYLSFKGTTRLRLRNTLDSVDVQDGVGRAKEWAEKREADLFS